MGKNLKGKEIGDGIYQQPNGTYDTRLFKSCDRVGIPRFSMHVLRHTFQPDALREG